jgi:hypothetical protein
MTLQQAINALMALDAMDIWIRPQALRGRGIAYDLSADGKRMETVPTHRGGSEYMTTLVEELCGEWDVVEVRTVLKERE